MTRRFNPAKKKEFLMSELGFKDLESREMDEFRANGNIGHFASFRISATIEGILVGLEDRALQLARQTREWFTESIRVNEKGVYSGGRAGIRRHAALCEWLLEKDATILFGEAADHCPKPGGAEPLDKVDLDYAMPLWLQAGRFDEVIALYEAFDSEAKALMSSRARTPRTVAYLIAAFHLAPGERFSRSNVEEACRRLLAKNVPEWAGRGLWTDLAFWLKIVYWDLADCQLEPREVILKAYDYLPGVSPP